MKRLSDFFYKKSNLYVSLILTLIMVFYASIVLGGKSKCFSDQLNYGQKALGLKLGYSYEYASSFFDSLNSDMLNCYRDMILIWDNIFPLLYGLMYIFWISLIFKNIVTKIKVMKLFNIFPLIHILMDWTENLTELYLINQFSLNQEISVSAVKFGSLISILKWSCSYLTYGILIVGLSIIIINKSKRR